MRFLIMNGAGNRFAVFDARTSDSFALNPEKVAAICKPGSSVMGELGADQLIVMRAPKDSTADVFMEIWNQKGFEVDACGNATRCVGWLVMTESGAQACTVQTNDALLHCTLAGTHQVAVDMGKPKLDWEQIPLEEVMQKKQSRIWLALWLSFILYFRSKPMLVLPALMRPIKCA